MKTPQDARKVILIVFIFIGTMFFIPVIVFSSFDGFQFMSMIPIIVFLIFGVIFGTMFKLITKKQKEYTNMQYPIGDRHCIHCHESIETYHKFCPLCGTEQTSYIICDYCGHRNSLQDLQCKECNALIK